MTQTGFQSHGHIDLANAEANLANQAATLLGNLQHSD